MLTVVLSGCVAGTYQRVNINEPRSEVDVQPLVDETAELQQCLDALGAPAFVWPTADGTAMAYAHTHQKGWGVRASVPIGRASGSLAVNSALAQGDALVLFFDQDWRLRFLRRGKLVDLLQAHPQRVQPVPPREPSGE